MTVNIAFSSDNNYAPFLCTAIYSLLKNSNTKNIYHIYILDGGISDENKNKISKSLKNFKNKKIKFVIIDQKIFQNVKQVLQLNQSSYYRLLLPQILPKISKIIYCDCDLIILNDISSLFQEKLGKNLIGCCQVFHPNYQSVLQRMYSNTNIKTAVNAGVALMNLKELRKNNFSDKAIDFVNNYSEKLIAGDQDILNILLAEKIKIIHPKWNATSYIFVTKNHKKCFMSQKTFKICLKNPSIVHFDGIKPWSSGSFHPYQKIFKKYLLATEFKNFKFKFNLKKYIQNKFFFTGNRLAKLLPNSFYDFIETQYLKNNFIEKKYKQINENN